MWDGKRSLAERIVYDALEIDRGAQRSATRVDIFEQALRNATPVLEVKPRRVGGATYRCRSRFAASARWRWRCAG